MFYDDSIITPVVYWSLLANGGTCVFLFKTVNQFIVLHIKIFQIQLYSPKPRYILIDSKTVPLAVWLNVSVHGVSFFLMMFDMAFCRIKMQINMVLLVFINVVLYMFLSFIVHAR